jgi:hypothetical protein
MSIPSTKLFAVPRMLAARVRLVVFAAAFLGETFLAAVFFAGGVFFTGAVFLAVALLVAMGAHPTGTLSTKRHERVPSRDAS